ncbi:unnamed protein product, partial [Ectocarpus sp. 13 AM-2016]
LVLHILGADHREGTTPQQTRAMLLDLFQRLGHDEHVQGLDFVLCGPNIPPHLHGTRHTFVHHHTPSAATVDQNIWALTVRLWYNSGLYHDVSGLFATPDALFLFNAGLWGYDDWEPTLEHILGCDRAANAAPVVVTSYCSEEASDDMETLERVFPVGRLEWLWKPEVNPHRSRVPRRTECGVEGRALFENHSWQALRPLRCRH